MIEMAHVVAKSLNLHVVGRHQNRLERRRRRRHHGFPCAALVVVVVVAREVLETDLNQNPRMHPGLNHGQTDHHPLGPLPTMAWLAAASVRPLLRRRAPK